MFCFTHTFSLHTRCDNNYPSTMRTTTLPEAESLRRAWKTELQEGHEVIEGHRGAVRARGAGWLSEGHLEGWRGREKLLKSAQRNHRMEQLGDSINCIQEAVRITRLRLSLQLDVKD